MGNDWRIDWSPVVVGVVMFGVLHGYLLWDLHHKPRPVSAWVHFVGVNGGYEAADLVPMVYPLPTIPNGYVLKAVLRNDGLNPSDDGMVSILIGYEGDGCGPINPSHTHFFKSLLPGAETIINLPVSETYSDCKCLAGTCLGELMLKVFFTSKGFVKGEVVDVSWSSQGINYIYIGQ